MITRSQRIAGGLMGMLVGDALGVPYEFKNARDLPPLADIEFEPPTGFSRTYDGLPPGTWSDDGAQALCLLASLLECGQWNIHDFGDRLVRWYDEGYMAVDGHVFDCGITTAAAIRRLRDGVSATDSGDDDQNANGNGALMRVLPLVLWHRGDDAELVEIAHQQSRVTHAHWRSQVCCALYCLWAKSTLNAAAQPWPTAVQKLRTIYQDNDAAREQLELHVRPDQAPHGNGSGYVVDCLHSARLACEQRGFESAVKFAVALGNDTDTTACVAGGIAGIQSGIDAIPKRWINGLRESETVAPLLQSLLMQS